MSLSEIPPDTFEAAGFWGYENVAGRFVRTPSLALFRRSLEAEGLDASLVDAYMGLAEAVGVARAALVARQCRAYARAAYAAMEEPE